MEAIANTELKIDKTNWQLVKFGDIVAEPKETCKDVVAEGITHVVGLEHIDSGDVHLCKSASVEESTTFTKRFKKGDVLFGRRRAYLKKAAQAEFDGICSGDITVFRAKAGLLPELLPFIVNNEKFFDYAVKHSAGGLSPRVKFKDLASYEFLLPPKAEQGRLAELLWAMDEVIEKEKKVLEKLERNKNSCIVEFLKNTQDSKKISDLGQVITGSTPSTSNSNYWGSSIPFVTPGDINDCTYVQDTERYLTLEGANQSRLIPRASVLVVCIGSTIGKVAINKFDCCSNQQINSIVPHAGVSSTYLFCSLKLLKKRILAKSGTTAVPIVNKTEFESIMIPFIDKTCMIQLENTFNYFESAIDGIKAKISASQALQKTLINQIF